LLRRGASGDMTVRELRRCIGRADTSWCTEKSELRGVFRLTSAVCGAAECQARLEGACTRTHPACGHPCGGVCGETTCLACLRCPPHPASAAASAAPAFAPAASSVPLPSAEDYCPICYTEEIGAAPAIRLGCGHVIHRQCGVDRIRAGWPGLPISFNHLQCALCGQSGRPADERGSMQAAVMAHPSLAAELAPVLALRDTVMKHGGGGCTRPNQ
jgi:hypothetical protein